MMYRDEIIAVLRKQYPYLVAEFGVKKLGLFGSVARGAQKRESDVDLVIAFEEPIGFRFLLLIEYLENLLGRRVDVITDEGLKSIRVGRVASEIRQDLMYV